jgi:hypothetical protein
VRKTAFIFAIFYLLSVVGYGLELHYCLGQITDVNVAWLETSCACDDAHEKALPNCCEEKEFFVQVDEEHQSSGSNTIVGIYHPIIKEIKWDDRVDYAITEQSSHIELSNGPPKHRPIYKRNCSFIFYG